MYVEQSVATVRLDQNEIRLIAIAMESKVFNSIEEHYNCLQQGHDGEHLFFDQKKLELRLIETFYCLYGEHRHYESLIQRAKKAFQEKRDERAKAAKDAGKGGDKE